MSQQKHKARLPIGQFYLASSSATRQSLLASADIDFNVIKAPIDEEMIRQSAQHEDMAFDDIAVLLAHMKAEAALRQHPIADDDMILGCDQLLVCGDQIINKPTSIEAAQKQLSFLQGKEHSLLTAAVLFKGGKRIWHHLDKPRLHMRKLDEAEIMRYLDQIGDAAFWSPGSYQIEGPGLHLFSDIRGDYQAILGLPMLPLLGILRAHGLSFQPKASQI